MASELESLIEYWKAVLFEHRLLMGPSTIYLVELTIRELKALQDSRAGQQPGH